MPMKSMWLNRRVMPGMSRGGWVTEGGEGEGVCRILVREEGRGGKRQVDEMDSQRCQY